MSTVANRAYYPGFDVLKFGLSVLIVAMHSKLGDLDLLLLRLVYSTVLWCAPTLRRALCK